MPQTTPSVYLETSVISYLVARPSRDVIAEAGRGDPETARRRLDAISGFEVLPSPREVEDLARIYVEERLIPAGEVNDALHLALASFHGIDSLLTWNCRHIAAAEVRRRAALINVRQGYSVPVLCTPEELMEF